MNAVRKVQHASHWGAYSLLVQDDCIIGVEPFAHDPAPSPIIHSVPDWLQTERRILTPMVRAGWLADGYASDRAGRGREPFVPVSWGQALDLVADEINRVRHTHGNAAIFAGSYGWTSCGRFHHAATLLKRMLNLVGGFTGHVDTYSTAAGPVILRHVLGSDAACSGLSSTLDGVAEHVETLVVFGSISPRTAQSEAGGIGAHRLEGYLRRIVERRVRVILVSPLRDDLPAWMDAEWWPIRPNTDTALMLGLAAEIVKSGDHDASFLSSHCSGADSFLCYLAGAEDGMPKDADWAEGITGIGHDRIVTLAKALTGSRSLLTVSWSLQRAQYGEQPFWAALGLAAVLGQIGLPGGGVGFGYASLGGMGAPFPVTRSPGMSAGRAVLESTIPVARIADMLLNPGGGYSYEGIERTYPDTRLVYWAGGNPFHHHQDLNRFSQAWQRPETIIVQDPMMTATAQRADILLPASTSLERNDISGNKRSDFLIAMQQAVTPRGEARSDFDIFNALASRLEVAEAFNEGRDEMSWVRHLYETTREDARARLGVDLPDFDSFWTQGYVRLPVKTSHTLLAGFRANPEANCLPTESGRIVLGSRLLAGLNYDDCRPHPAWIEPDEWLGKAGPEGALHLISRQPTGRLHSQLDTGSASQAGKHEGREIARLNPQDATERGIQQGQAVRLWNARGQCLATADLTGTVRPGVIVLPTGAWLTQPGADGLEVAGNPNVLTLDVPTSQFGQGCSAHTCLVRVEPWPASD